VNHLAHLFLAGENKGLIVGNFIADMVKGKKMFNYSSQIQKGILMHRAIDSFTDTHPVVRQCTRLLQPHMSKFAPMALDVFFDHFLSLHWSKYSHEPLYAFAQRKTDFLASQHEILPEHSQRFLEYLRTHEVLYNYGNMPTLEKVFRAMSRRTTIVENPLADGPKFLIMYFSQLEKLFLEFFPRLQGEFENWKIKYASLDDL
jgi:acyl carrier protein phosphodiesterase